MSEPVIQQSAAQRVLVVEDEPIQREFLAFVLEQFGCDHDMAGSIREAEGIFSKGRYACSLVDIRLPDGDGRDLLARLGAIDNCLVQIVLTGDAHSDTIIASMRSGAFDYLTKPVESATLTAALSRALAHHSVILERAELFHLLYEEREQLRARVDAATADIRQYAAACELSNARLRSLLHLTQVSSNYYSEEALIRRVFEEIREHMPLQGIAICDHANRRVVALGLVQASAPDSPVFVSSGGSGILSADYDPLLAEVEPEQMLANYAMRELGIDAPTRLVYPQRILNRTAYVAGFFLGGSFKPGPADREFLDMCAYLLAFEWEQGKLLYHVAHQASLGNIAVELARNFVQPITAIRTAADFLRELADDPEFHQGLTVIQENLERLQRQTQEFRKLSVLRENCVETVNLEEYLAQATEMLAVAIHNRSVTVHTDITTSGECVLINGAALARTFLDLMLGALRTVHVGGQIWAILREANSGHVAFELSHDGPQEGIFVDAHSSVVASAADSEQAHLGLQLAERTVHACGGTLNFEFDQQDRGVLRITLPRNAAKPALHQGDGA
jgi:DNA-binding response OmpR family regulator